MKFSFSFDMACRQQSNYFSLKRILLSLFYVFKYIFLEEAGSFHQTSKWSKVHKRKLV